MAKKNKKKSISIHKVIAWIQLGAALVTLTLMIFSASAPDSYLGEVAAGITTVVAMGTAAMMFLNEWIAEFKNARGDV